MKAWYQSKTIWSGLLKALGGLSFLVATLLTGEVSTGEAVVSGASILWGAIDILIRYKTVQPLR